MSSNLTKTVTFDEVMQQSVAVGVIQRLSSRVGDMTLAATEDN